MVRMPDLTEGCVLTCQSFSCLLILGAVGTAVRLQ